jgi:O-acetyl-ADP-ribose deacetylase (regulator of RNase III)
LVWNYHPEYGRNILSNYSLNGTVKLDIHQGDLTEEVVDAIVNAANSMLMHDGGLAMRIADRGGEVIRTESAAWISEFGSVSHSNPAYTHAGDLPCKYVIHAVGPFWGDGDEMEKLGVCTTSCLALAAKLGQHSIAFPAISTGIYNVPLEVAAEGMINAFQGYAKVHPEGPVLDIRLVLYDNLALQKFTITAERLI